MPNWTGEVSYMKMGKSYWTSPPTFVSFEASNYGAAIGRAFREAKKRFPRGVRIEQCKVLVQRIKGAGETE